MEACIVNGRYKSTICRPEIRIHKAIDNDDRSLSGYIMRKFIRVTPLYLCNILSLIHFNIIGQILWWFPIWQRVSTRTKTFQRFSSISFNKITDRFQHYVYKWRNCRGARLIKLHYERWRYQLWSCVKGIIIVLTINCIKW